MRAADQRGEGHGREYTKTDLLAPVSENKDPQGDERRPALPGDEIHPTATARHLAVGHSHTVRILSKLRYNWSGIRAEAGDEYRISVPSEHTWQDKDSTCGPAGWKSEQLPWYSEAVVEALEKRRRVPAANWFQLSGALNDEDDEVFAIESGGAANRASRDAELYLFANDLPSRYDNYDGFLNVTIERIGPAARDGS